jgi:hypothetical protein
MLHPHLQWIKMDATQPLVISGPRGAGKSTLVAHVVDHRPNVVRIDVKALLERKEELMVCLHWAGTEVAPSG